LRIRDKPCFERERGVFNLRQIRTYPDLCIHNSYFYKNHIIFKLKNLSSFMPPLIACLTKDFDKI
jgi:hypothetical protein